MDPVVKIRDGELRGAIVDGVHSFKGVPYAAPPFGANRLRAPQPVEPWSGVRDAVGYGPMAPHLPYPPPIDTLIPELGTSGEDCLNLNIWSRELGPARQPVMVWIPGGMFEVHGTGACPWYDGSRFARDGVVCVTINYRVGAEGFLYLGDNPGEGCANRGLLDQLAALKWVRENIGAFGGDPDNVTIFGESAGALAIGTLLAMPRAEGLFRRAILQSGAAHHVSSATTAERVARELATKLGVPATREAIATVPIDRVLHAQAELKLELVSHPDPQRWGNEVVSTFLPWQPAVDGNVVPALPYARIVAGASADVDVLIGTNMDENRLFLAVDGSLDRITEEVLAGAVTAYGLPTERALAVYRSARPGASAGDVLAAIQTDWYWRIPAIRLAEARAQAPASTYMYEFMWPSPQLGGRLGACHSLEIPFVFDTLGHGTEPLWGPNPPQPLADTMHAAWVAFATSGQCEWPQYDVSRRATMRFDLQPKVVLDARVAERELWDGLR